MLEAVDVELVCVVSVSFASPPVVVVVTAFVVAPVAEPSLLPFAAVPVEVPVVSAAGCDVVAAGLSVVAASARNRKRGLIRPAVATLEQRRKQATAFRRELLSRMVVIVV
jgi:hypothetical protein